MPSFQDSIFIFVLALLLFGPKKLPELARYLGKLMNEFRRASSEFRLQMDDEFRAIEQAEQQKKIAAIEAAAPVTPLNIPEPEHPHLPAPVLESSSAVETAETESVPEYHIDRRTGPAAGAAAAIEPLPIASNGDLYLMPPSTGLPVSRTAGSLGGLFERIPHTADPSALSPAEPEAQSHG